MKTKDQNGNKTCLKDGQPKFIQNWQKQCGQCSHGVFVAVRVKDHSDDIRLLDKAYLFKCPHVNWLSIDYVPTPFTINSGALLAADVQWQQVKGSYINGQTVFAYALIPKTKWFEILSLPVLLRLARCPSCES